jgi:hypothetical protein
MKKKSFDAVAMVRKIRDKESVEFWKGQDQYLSKLKVAAKKLHLHTKKRKKDRVA